MEEEKATIWLKWEVSDVTSLSKQKSTSFLSEGYLLYKA